MSVDNNTLTVAADHEEKADDGSKHVVRKFTRKYTLPQNAKAESVTSNLSADGVLMISAPVNPALENKTKNVQITQK